MSAIPSKPAEAVEASVRIAQIVSLVKNNQLVTALLLFILWQAGAIATAVEYAGGVC